MRVDERAEIGVLGQPHPLFGNGEFDNHLVGGARRGLGDGSDVVAGCPQCANDRDVAALVGQESPAQRLSSLQSPRSTPRERLCRRRK
jgi:hypothetical protein